MLTLTLVQPQKTQTKQTATDLVTPMIYVAAAHTGLRASELASLTCDSFRLDDEWPAVPMNRGRCNQRNRLGQ